MIMWELPAVARKRRMSVPREAAAAQQLLPQQVVQQHNLAAYVEVGGSMRTEDIVGRGGPSDIIDG